MTFERQPFFYEEWDDASSEILIKCDEELQLLSGRLGDFMNPVTKITAYYGVKDQFELTNKLKHIEAFKGIKFPMVKTPIGFKPDFSSRYFTEDIPYGLLVIKSIGEKVGLEMPEIDKIIRWYEKVMNKSYFKNGLLMGEDVADTGAIQDSDVFKSILRY